MSLKKHDWIGVISCTSSSRIDFLQVDETTEYRARALEGTEDSLVQVNLLPEPRIQDR